MWLKNLLSGLALSYSSQACRFAVSQLWHHVLRTVAVFFRKHGEQQFTFCMCRMCSMCSLLVSASKEHLQTKMIDFYNEKLVHTEKMFRKYCTKNFWQNHYNSKDCIVKKPADLGTIDQKQWPRMRRAGSTGVEEGEGAYGNFSLSAVGCILTQGLRM